MRFQDLFHSPSGVLFAFPSHDRHHKKSGLWLFNGGHIDKGENPEQALRRGMGEEWGEIVDLQIIGEPKLLTITTIVNPVIKCKKPGGGANDP